MDTRTRVRRFLASSSIALGAVLLILTPVAHAQQKFPIVSQGSAAEATYPQQFAIDVGDVAEHKVRIYEIRRGEAANPTRFRGVKVVESWARGVSDYIDYSGPTFGYIVWRLENGDRIFGRYSGTVHSVAGADGTREYQYQGLTVITGCTGEFRNIRGTIRDTTRGASKAGKALSNAERGEGEYWFEE